MRSLCFCGLFVIIFLCEFASCLDEHQGAFVQTGDELHYFVDPHQWGEGISAHVFLDNTGDNRSGDSEKRGENSAASSLSQLKFEPPSLEFGIHALGIPELKKVKVSNPTTSTVRFDAISGSTVHFHCSFFEHKTIEPGASTTFDVVFLPRQESHIENTLFIHSSLGTFSYIVSGVGTSNPYRLRPFVGARVPLNGTFSSPIEVHNPHSTTLQVTEVYTSGADLHLELPNGGQDASAAAIWEIPPFQTQAVIKAKFIGSRERNATAYIRIKTNRDEKPALIVPLEVEVVSKPGLYSAQDLLDFGTITSQDQSKWLTLNVYNTLNRTLLITSIEVDVEAVSVNFKPVNLTSDSRTPSCIAKVAFYGNKAERIEKKKSGFVKIKSDDPSLTLNVPYNVQILHGKLYHEDEEVSFYSNFNKEFIRNISVWNAFNSPIAVHTVSLPRKAKEHFEIINFNDPVILMPNKKTSICQLKFVGPLNDVHYETRLRLLTNVTKFDIPLHIFNGKLRYTLYSIDQTEFDFGALDADQERFILFAITNENPISINLFELTNAIMSHTKLELLGVEPGNHTVLAYDHSPLEYKWKAGENFTLAAKSFAVFRYSVKAPHDRSSYHGRMRFYSLFEKIEIPVQFTVEEGTVVSVPERIIIDEAFPGKISSHSLQVFSTFPRDMPVLRLSTLSNDPRFVFESFDIGQTPMIKHGEMSHLGRIYFLPLATCLDDCYVGLPLDTEDGKRWIHGMRLPPNLPEIDYELYHKLRSKWQKTLANKEHIVNGTIMVDSTEVKGFAIPMEGRLTWPRLIKNPSLHFPLTAVGNYTIVNLTLHNPSSLPVAVQMLPLTIYPNPEDLLKFFKNEVQSPLTNYIEMDDVLMFSLRDSELYNARRESPVPMFRQALEQALGTQIPRFTLSLLLQPGMKVRIRVGFLPSDYEMRSSLLLIRNNLTVLETVTLYGRGAKMELRVGSRMPNSLQPLMFEIQEKHLKECENIKRLQHKLPTSLTVRRSFVARNTGELTVTVGNLTINGMYCQNRGFRILNCESFKLKPNETHVLEVAFTPDFTLSWYEASLQLFFVGMHAPMVYTLGASIPREWLPKCQAAMPRPYWEPLMYYSCVTALGFMLICIVASAYLEGDRIITCSLRKQLQANERRVFDLNDFNQYSSAAQEKESEKNKEKPSDKPKQTVGAVDSANVSTSSVTITTITNEHEPLLKRLILLLVSLVTKRKLTRLADSDVANQSPSSSIDDTSKNNSGKNVIHANLRRKSSTDNNADSTKPRKTSSNGANNGSANNNALLSATTIPPFNSNHYGRKTPVAGQQQKNNTSLQSNVVVVTPMQQYQPTTSKKSSKYASKTHQQHPNAPKNARKALTPRPEDKDHQESGKGGQNYETHKPLIETVSTSDHESSKKYKSGGNKSDSEGWNKTLHEYNYADNENSNKLSNVGAKSAFTPIKPIPSYKPLPSTTTPQSSSNVQPLPQIKTLPPTSAASVSPKAKQQRKPQEKLAVRPNVQQNDSSVKQAEKDSNVGRSKHNSVHDAASESEDSNVPEWETLSLPSPDGQNIDEAFDLLASETETFSTLIDNKTTSKPASSTPKTKVDQQNASKNRYSSTSTSSGAMSSMSKGKENLSSNASLSWSSSSLDASSSSSPTPEHNAAPAHNRKKKQIGTAAPQSASPMGGRSKVSPTHTRSKKRPTNPSNVVGVIGSKLPPPSSLLSVPTKPPFPWFGRNVVGPQSGPNRVAPKPSADPSGGRSSTIMQQLRDERFRRLQEYRSQKRKAGEEWPGFDLSPVVENLWDDDYDPWRASMKQPQQPPIDTRSNIWSNNVQPENIWSTNSGEGPLGSATSLFDLTSNVQYVGGWSPNDSAPFGSQSPVQQIRRHSATPASSLAESPFRGITTPPPDDSSIVAWGPTIAVNDVKTEINTYSTDSIWGPTSTSAGANAWPNESNDDKTK